MVMDFHFTYKALSLGLPMSRTFIEFTLGYPIHLCIYLRTIQPNLYKIENHTYTFSVLFARTSAKLINTWHKVHHVTFLHLLSAKATLHTPYINACISDTHILSTLLFMNNTHYTNTSCIFKSTQQISRYINIQSWSNTSLHNIQP